MTIRLIVTDLDGTLLNDKKEISVRTIAAMREARERGIKVAVATGRMHFAAAYFARKIDADAPIISCNGALVKTLNGEIVSAKYLPAGLVREVIEACYRHGWYVQWYDKGRVYAKEFRPAMFSAYRMIEGFRVHEVGDAFRTHTEGVIQVVIRDADGGITGIREVLCEKFGARLALQQNTDISIDITSPGINKAAGLRYLLKWLGMKKEEVIAFGDADNDIAMLRYAGCGVAMKNASKEVRELANVVTDDCNHDGVAKAVEAYVLRNCQCVQ